MTGRRARAGLARSALALAVAAAAAGGVLALVGTGRLWKAAHRVRHQTLEQAQERLFGAEYMASVRRIRAAVGEDESVFFVDAQHSETGAAVFALYALAPRRVVDLGDPREARRVLRHRPAARDRAVVVVRDGATPLELTTAAEFLAR